MESESKPWERTRAACVLVGRTRSPGSARGPRACSLRGRAAIKALAQRARTRAACAPRIPHVQINLNRTAKIASWLALAVGPTPSSVANPFLNGGVKDR